MLHSARSASQGRVSLPRAAGRFKTPLRVREAGRARCWAARGCVLALLRARRARAADFKNERVWSCSTSEELRI